MNNTWNLSSFDLFSLSMTIKGAWIYNEAPDFNRMKDALASLQKVYPHLTGRFDKNIKALIWTENSSEALPFTTCDLKNHSVAELKGNPRIWSLIKPYDIQAFKDGKIGPFSAVLAELKDGAALFVQCAHATMDGATFYNLTSQWSALYRGEDIHKMTVDQSLIPSPDSLSKEETLRQVQQNGWMQMKASQLIKMLWYLFRNNRIKTPFIMEVSQEEINGVKAKSEAGTNAVLSAIAAKALAEKMGKDKLFKLLFVADLRGRISGIEEGFFGNISQPVIAEGVFDSKMDLHSLVCLIDKSLKDALNSGKAEQNVRLSQCSSYYSLPYFYFDPSDMNSPDPGTLYFNNQLKFKACELDWGTGKPEYVFPNELTDMIKFWQPVSGGPVQIIFGGLAAKIMSR